MSHEYSHSPLLNSLCHKIHVAFLITTPQLASATEALVLLPQGQALNIGCKTIEQLFFAANTKLGGNNSLPGVVSALTCISVCNEHMARRGHLSLRRHQKGHSNHMCSATSANLISWNEHADDHLLQHD